ncbi:MAG: cytochrome c [Pseudanabaena sp. CoA8_M7]|nr:cytochrome c [Pseudanabaena sp. CoA8_M7]
MINKGANLIKDADVIVETQPSNTVFPSDEVRSPKSSKFMAILIAFVMMTFAIAIWLLRPPLDPYTQSVLNLSGDPVQGRSIFVMNCVACHGQWANGKVGPSLHGVSERKSDVKLVQQVVSGETPPMPQFQPSPQDMADLLSYLKQL